MDPYGIEWAEHTDLLVDAADGDWEWYRRTAGTLLRPGDRTAVDVGCGGGGMVAALSGALEPDGLVIGADGSPEVLAAAAAAHRGGTARVLWVRADLDAGIDPVREAAGGAVDVVWAANSVHHLADQQAGVTALAGLLRPGGRLALAEGGLPSRALPWDLGIGEPGLEVRLDAAQDRWFARMRAGIPGSVRMPHGWGEALRRAGLTGVRTLSTLLEPPAPLTATDRERVVDGLAHRVALLRPGGMLDPADAATWDRLLDRDDPAYLGRRSDLQALQARTVHLGERPT